MNRFVEAVLQFQEAQATPSRRQIAWALTSIAAFWAILLYSTWAHWGDITIDCGREAYVPWALSQGKQLYRDVWFPYGPVAPYFNALLYSIFGAKLNVLYWAGALSALVSALLLLLLGIRFSAIAGGWTAGMILLADSMTPGTIFSFPLPYSFSAVYGCVTTIVFILAAVEAARNGGRVWVFASGCAAALTLALKLEMGAALCAALAVLIILRWIQARSLRSLALDLAACLPGAAACGLLLAWTMPPGGMDFLIQQNWMSTPGTYFMKTYGAMWLSFTGGAPRPRELGHAALLCLATSIAWLTIWAILTRATEGVSQFVARRVLPLGLLAGVTLSLAARAFPGSKVKWALSEIFTLLFLPPVIFSFVLIAAALTVWAFCRGGFDRRLAPFTVLFAASGFVGLRLLYNMKPSFYSVYVEGPAVLSLFLVLRSLSVPFLRPDRRHVLPVEFILSVGMLGALAFFLASPYRHAMRHVQPFHNARGDLYMPAVKVPRYAAAVRFMEEKAALGQSVLSVPEDSGLYFFAGVQCPTRIYVYTPGVLTPGWITRLTICEIEKKRVDYLIWSNRQFREYGVPEFGQDFDQELGSYLKTHYRPVGSLGPEGGPGWNAVIWQRLD